MFAQFADETRFLTPYLRSVVAARRGRQPNAQFERIYRVKRQELKAFVDAGNGDLITLGTDHPSSGEYLTPFGVHRELLALSRAGLPNALVLIKAGRIHDPAALMRAAEGTIGPASAADSAAWAPDPPQRRP